MVRVDTIPQKNQSSSASSTLAVKARFEGASVLAADVVVPVADADVVIAVFSPAGCGAVSAAMFFDFLDFFPFFYTVGQWSVI